MGFMPKQLRQGKNTLVRETLHDIDALLNHEKFRRMIIRQLETMREHCEHYPLMDKDRKVTITLSLKPVVNQQAKNEGRVEYDRAVFSASVGSPSLPSTSVEYKCVVVNGQPYYNLEDAENPLQMTFRDVDGEDEIPDFGVKDGKASAVKD
jgi:hypothetical protein